MSRKAIRKDFFMEIRKSLGRFLSILFIVALGVSFFSGIRASEPDMRLSGDAYYDDADLMDIQIRGTLGITQEDIDEIGKLKGVEVAQGGYSVDVFCEVFDQQRTLHVMSLAERLNRVTVSEGRLPEKADECLVDQDFLADGSYRIGDELVFNSGTKEPLTDTLNGSRFRIVGVGNTPYYIADERGSSPIGAGNVAGFVMVMPEAFSLDVFTEVYVLASGAKAETAYTDGYESKVLAVQKRIEEIAERRGTIRRQQIQDEIDKELAEARTKLANGEQELLEAEEKAGQVGQPKWYVRDRGEALTAYDGFGQNADRIGAIGRVFPVLFFLVAALISLTTMTRMVEAQRGQIGTLKALGYSRFSIAGKYLNYALLATLGGSVIGTLLGEKLFPFVIIHAYRIMYPHLPNIIIPYQLDHAVAATAAALACTILATWFACMNALRAQPAVLMRPPAPMKGKRVLIEKVTILWKRLSFIWKSTIRNLFRYKKRFFMTVFGIGGCMALMIVGYGIKDSIFAVAAIQYGELEQADATVYLSEDLNVADRDQVYRMIGQHSEIQSSAKMHTKNVTLRSSEEKEEVYLSVPEQKNGVEDFLLWRDRITHQKYQLPEEGAILTEKMAKMLNVKAGETITIEDPDKGEQKVRIAFISENYMGHSIYLSAQQYLTLYGQPPENNSMLIKLSGYDEKKMQEVGEELLSVSGVLGISYMNEIEGQVKDMLNSMNAVIIVLIVSAGMLAFVVLYNLNNININERKRELATIRVLGFYDGEVGAYVYRENIVLTLIGVGFGIISGMLLHQYVIVTVEIDSIMFGRIVAFRSYVYSILWTIGFSAVVNFVMYFKLKKIDMIESLKSIE